MLKNANLNDCNDCFQTLQNVKKKFTCFLFEIMSQTYLQKQKFEILRILWKKLQDALFHLDKCCVTLENSKGKTLPYFFPWEI